MYSKAAAADVARELVPLLRAHAREVDAKAAFPVEALRALRDSGLMGLLVPREHGGMGGGVHDVAEVGRVLAHGCASTAMIWAMHSQQVDSIVAFADARLAERLLPRVAAGEVFIASVTTEPGSGGQILRASASLTGGTGTLALDRKAPIVTGGEHADGFLITMRDSAESSADSVTLVYADRDQLSLEVTGDWDPMGMRGTRSVGMRVTGEVEPDQVVGERGGFRRVALASMVPVAHVAWSACWLGAAQSALSDVVRLIRSAAKPGGLDPHSDLVTERLARVRIDLELVSGYLRQVCDKVAAHRAQGRPLDDTATQIHLNTLKVAAAELTFGAVDRLVQLCGMATGYLKTSELPLERHFRDLRSASLNIANERLLKVTGALSLMDRPVTLI
ncbi:acyl-CoA dehydrogenase family protein [Lentzea sp. BCCO 10_0856]|uniref:Acyl-CoA dehydrogenase family protein n=1 Tax=Lentzea miocenica TaxID=3095431 RepID=A0ABU4SZM7_9PSEU|nr:acyl-CoA dehydrogenase family protein [Lentzea sp. BCCO 10_0856]MDX8031366.1 acyl-CoA dehydrogenase family protein [Lentzea sp. BCCO 10_0856]